MPRGVASSVSAAACKLKMRLLAAQSLTLLAAFMVAAATRRKDSEELDIDREDLSLSNEIVESDKDNREAIVCGGGRG
ncbi:hypothetical protein ACLKA7_007739 [Drosophila subpalustris]